MKIDPEFFRVYSARTFRGLSSSHQIVERPGYRDDHQQSRHHPAKNKKHPLPVPQPRDNFFRLRKADLLTQALDNLQRRGDRPERTGKMRFERIELIL